tara:strand:+ start:4476 stop:5489 length:1014 start_codon:yes stop_codon:yes gene_type:complete
MLLKKVDRDLSIIHSKIRISRLSPVNVSEEKKKVFRDNNYDPKLKYPKTTRNYSKIEKHLLNLKTDRTVYGVLLRKKINELLNMLRMIDNVGKREFSKYSIKVYGKPSRELVAEARRILKTDETEVWRRYSKTSMTKKFMDTFVLKNMNWKVVEKDMVAGATFSTKSKTLYINKNRNYSENDVRRLVVHEIGTHILRSENADKRDYKMFKFGFPGYLETEEGLAAYNEYVSGLLTPRILKNYAGRVLANHLGLKSSFSTVYNSLLEHFPKGEAWTLTLRSKRGISNTAKPGAFTKDHIYLKGFLRVKKYAEVGGNMRKLYIGKIGVEHVPLLPYILR